MRTGDVKRPSFQFYPADWLGSPDILLMTPEQEGAYIHLLCICWRDTNCSLPDDADTLARLSRLDRVPYGEAIGGVMGCFIPHPTMKGRLTNARLWAEREKQDRHRAKSREYGKKGAKKRWGSSDNEFSEKSEPNRVPYGEAIATPMVTPLQKNGSSSSSSSSSSSIAPRDPTTATTEQEYCTVQHMVDYFNHRWGDLIGNGRSPGVTPWGKQHDAAAPICRERTRAEVESIVDGYLRLTDPKLIEKGYPFLWLPSRLGEVLCRERPTSKIPTAADLEEM